MPEKELSDFDWIAPQPPRREPDPVPGPAKPAESGVANALLKILEIAQRDHDRINAALAASAEIEALDLTVRILNVTAHILEPSARVDTLMEKAEEAA